MAREHKNVREQTVTQKSLSTKVNKQLGNNEKSFHFSLHVSLLTTWCICHSYIQERQVKSNFKNAELVGTRSHTIPKISGGF